MSCQASLRIAGKAKYKRMIELGKTMLLVYANPEPMLISVKQMKSPNHSILANEDIRMDVEI